jgi:endonuclease/exonuclease/phosphatase family metal-dependent hydrolase
MIVPKPSTLLQVAGDFNMQPDTPPYLVATTGTLDKANPQFPPMPAPITQDWKLSADPMKSAYQVANGTGTDDDLIFHIYL